MKAINEVGWRRVLAYAGWGLWKVGLAIMIYSPLRVLWLRWFGATIGKNCVIETIEFINLDRGGLKNLKVGDMCYLGRGCLFDVAGEIEMGDLVTMGPRVQVLTHTSMGYKQHPLHKRFSSMVDGVEIGRGAFIGAGAIILPGMVVGEEAGIAAGSVVKSKVKTKTLVAGIPARVKNSW